jgi:hypothetical protein
LYGVVDTFGLGLLLAVGTNSIIVRVCWLLFAETKLTFSHSVLKNLAFDINQFLLELEREEHQQPNKTSRCLLQRN